MIDLNGRAALITGAGRGIGAEAARKLAGHGARVVVNDLDPDAAEDTVRSIEAAGGTAVVCAGNIADRAFADRFVGTAVDSFGGVDIIVNNAGFTWDSVIQKMTDEQWDTILDVHLKAPFQILRAAQPIISAAAKAEAVQDVSFTRKIVNVSSLAGTSGNAGQANYSAAKAGILGLTKTLAKEWGRYQVTVNAVAFGVIRTRLTDPNSTGEPVDVGGRALKFGVNPELLAMVESAAPLRRLGTPEEAAGAIYLLCTPESDYITGEVLTCSGGLVA